MKMFEFIKKGVLYRIKNFIKRKSVNCNSTKCIIKNVK